MKEFSDVLDNISTLLKFRGFQKQAEEIDKESLVYRGVGLAPERKRLRPETPTERQLSPGTKGFQEGELYTEIDPGTGQETPKVWGEQNVRDLEDLKEKIKSGRLRTELLMKAYRSETNPYVKELYRKALSEEAAKSQIHIKLSNISSSLKDKGYETLADRIASISNAFLSPEGSDESHSVPSLEDIYEASKSPLMFNENIQKVLNVYEGISNIVKEFMRSYGGIEQDSDKIRDLIRRTDSLINIKLREIRGRTGGAR